LLGVDNPAPPACDEPNALANTGDNFRGGYGFIALALAANAITVPVERLSGVYAASVTAILTDAAMLFLFTFVHWYDALLDRSPDFGFKVLSLLKIVETSRKPQFPRAAPRTFGWHGYILFALVSLLSFRFRSRVSLELGLVALRHQVIVLRRQRPHRLRLLSADLSLLKTVNCRERWSNFRRHRHTVGFGRFRPWDRCRQTL
jgi:hypothetical protein